MRPTRGLEAKAWIGAADSVWVYECEQPLPLPPLPCYGFGLVDQFTRFGARLISKDRAIYSGLSIPSNELR